MEQALLRLSGYPDSCRHHHHPGGSPPGGGRREPTLLPGIYRLRLREQYALLQVREEELERAQAQLPELQRQLAPLFPQVVLDPVPRPRRES